MVRASFTESYAAAAAAAAGVLPSTASAAAAAAAAAAAYLHPHPYLHKPEAHFLFPGAGESESLAEIYQMPYASRVLTSQRLARALTDAVLNINAITKVSLLQHASPAHQS